MSIRGAIYNGLRIARRKAVRKPHQHLLHRFQQTKDSKNPDTRWGPEYTAQCRYCGAYMTVYFDDEDALEQQGYKPHDHIVVESDDGHFHWKFCMVISGNWNRFACGEIKKRV